MFSSLQTYGAKVDQVKAEIGGAVKESDIESALKAKKYKIVTVTHVDTSTGERNLCGVVRLLNSNDSCAAVLSNIKAVAEVVKRVSPDTLVILFQPTLIQAYSSRWNNRLLLMLSAL
jgi:alanine-glyoxylate transaminase/serine-glyoxylate transaminase/serine-pyruvate transaminase